MRNHPLYQKLEQTALDGNYTIEQVQDLDIDQASGLLGTRVFSLTFLNNMKRNIITVLHNRDDELNLQQLKQKAKTWLDENSPSWEAERGREGDKPFVTIWLQGKP